MKDIYKLEDLKTLEAKTKVRYVVKSYEQYKNEATEINALGKRFFEYKVKLDFETKYSTIETCSTKIVDAHGNDVKKIVREAIEKIEDKDVRTLLLNEFKDD